jgi:uncharacterized protein (DUF849 family)
MVSMMIILGFWAMLGRRLTSHHGNLNLLGMLQACLNGFRGHDYSPAVPLTPEALARDAAACLVAGTNEFHIHPRDAGGFESFAADDIGAALKAIRARVPGVPVGVSTREGILADPAGRQVAFKAWKVLPDYVSVNLSEADAPEVIRLMLRRGIGIEAGLATVADAERYVALPEAALCLRVLIEIEEQESAAAIRVAHGIIAVLDWACSKLPRQLHGFDASKWLIHAEAIRLGLDQRIGFEDGGFLPDGRMAQSNAELIAAAVKRGVT